MKFCSCELFHSGIASPGFPALGPLPAGQRRQAELMVLLAIFIIIHFLLSSSCILEDPTPVLVGTICGFIW